MPSLLTTTRSFLRASSSTPSPLRPSSLKHLIQPRNEASRAFTMSNPAHKPHPDFKAVEATRPEFEYSSKLRFTKTPSPSWAFGSGPNSEHPSTSLSHVSIDPHAEGRPIGFNYKLLISAIVPRPIAFVSTLSPDGKTQNLAPFSYFNFVNHDPPILVVGFSSSVASAKDTLRNVLESKEAVINIISETFVEAANSTSINAPYGVSEWDVAGLTPVYDTETVKAPRVKEAVFSVEVKLHDFTEFDSKSKPGQKSGTMCTFEGTRFWAREDAINEDRNMIDPEVLRPISRLGGITYGRTTEVLEIPRPDFEKDLGGKEAYEQLKKA